MIDMHTHLDLYPDALQIVEKVNAQNIFTLCVTTSPRAWLATKKVFAKYNNIYVALGLHPEIAKSKANEIQLFLDFIKETRFIGEVGLDGSKNFESTYSLQKEIFTNILKECSKQGHKILSVHARNSTDDVMGCIKENLVNCKVIIHWFSGTEKQLFKAVAADYWFSINPKMCKSKKGQEIIKKIPLDRILLESDGPFVTFNNKFFYPWETKNIIQEVSNLISIDEQELTEIIKRNLARLLEFKNTI